MILFHLVVLILVFIVTKVVHCFTGVSICPCLLVPISLLISFGTMWLAGIASRGVATRKVTAAPPPENRKAWYIQSDPPPKGLPHSCSFVEFDERGDYLDFAQHQHAYEKIMALAKEHENLIVVMFVHGWCNGAHSGNVISFNEFLHQLSQFADHGGTSYRVHGLYLAWRGGNLRPVVDKKDPILHRVTHRFQGKAIIDFAQTARISWLANCVEYFSYFNRKSVPEHKFAGTSLSRTIYSCARVAKRYCDDSLVFLIGHSFGGLMLERTFQNATIGELTDAWPWEDPKAAETTKANPLPFDTVLLVNSAAPSIYAKQFQSYLAAHRGAMRRSNVTGADSPIFISLTSTGDWATGLTHYWANTFCYWVPTLWRDYRGDDFILEKTPGAEDVKIPEGYYYRRTPGHNPLLVNRFIELSKTQPVEPSKQAERQAQSSVSKNLLQPAGDPFEFSTTARDGSAVYTWRVNFPPVTEAFKTFSTFEGRRPVAWTQESGDYPYRESAYWIASCTPEIIFDHTDIWSQQAMDTYAALYRIALYLRDQKPRGGAGSPPAPK